MVWRIGVDAKRLTRNRTGLGNYSRFVVRLLRRYGQDIAMYLATPSEGDRSLYADILQGNHVELLLPQAERRGMPGYGAYWRSFAMVQALNGLELDLYHGLSNELPYSAGRLRCPTVVTMHDLIYEWHPEWYSWWDVRLYRAKYRRSCELATHVVAVSEQTKRDVVAMYGIPSSRVTVLYQGCGVEFRQPVSEALRAEVARHYALPSRYLLSVGTVEERKNAGVLVEALSLLKDQGVHLVLAGRETEYATRVRARAAELGLTARVHFLGSVPAEWLPALYHGALMMLYPSKFEGFGIPVLEALCCGVPVVAASGSCLEESGGPDSLYVPPQSVEGFAESIQRILEDEALRNHMVEAGYTWSERFSDARLAEALLHFYAQVIEG